MRREMDVAGAPSVTIDTRQLFRGLARNWWRILLVWLVVSAPLVYVIYTLVEPTYQASSLVLVESNQNDPFSAFSNPALSGQAPTYLKTQLVSVTSDPVLAGAFVVEPRIAKFSMFKNSNDPAAELRKRLEVQILPDTNFIKISLESTNPQEAADTVNAVALAYKLATQPDDTQLVPPAITGLRKDTAQAEVAALEEYRKKEIDSKIKMKKDALLKLAKNGGVQFKKDANAKGEPVDTPQATSDDLLEQFRSTNELLMQTDFQLIEAEAKLTARQAQAAGDVASQSQAPDSNVPNEQIREEFTRDPEVIELVDRIKQVKNELDHLESISRKKSDPSRKAAQTQLSKLEKQYYDLWETKKGQIRERLLVTTSGVASNGERGESIPELMQQIAVLKTKKDKLTELYKKFEVTQKDSHADTVQAAFLNTELANLTTAGQQIERRLLQLKFTQDKSAVTIPRIDRAKAPRDSFNNKRLKFMAIVPVVVLGALLGLFLLLEIRAERVVNPDSLSSRVQSEVYALPPIPRQRAIGASGPDDQIDRFIQRLDHLRFAVCGEPHDAEMGRCVLVTSAIGGEGKTTLAAQLAARCGNAGISTLLIDADLRRASLCPLLEVPEGPGLSDALQGDVKVDELIIPVQGGTFHLLAAGTPVPDASRIVQGRSFPMLIAQLRQTYEMIIIDSPPVLPVPDALALGRWTDGALLATRFEVSRSPQVERARRQLDNAGIPVLGTVINGLRSSDSYYGRYTYSRQRATQTPSADAV
ncbi:exopolysaccharide transport family protein [Aquisphaera giovannonii]|nr:polysaccharide biosynthesis tyrosine autokinase [Aquisphaera giovannonii]